MAKATAGSIVIDLMMKTGMFETDADRAERRMKKLAKQISDLANQSKKASEQSLKQNSQESLNSNAGILSGLGLGGLGKGLSISAILTSYSQLSDEAIKVRGVLNSATSENIKFGESLEDVTAIAAISQTNLEGVGVAYARIALATEELGISQKEVSDIVETVSLALKVNGATAAETQSALIQLSQAFGKGKLDGDEFRTMMEAAPPVMRQLAKSMGVPFGALKDLAAEGKLTADVLVKAFNNPEYLKQLRGQAMDMQTVSGSITVLRNSLVNLVSSFDKMIPISKLVSSAITGVSGTVQMLADTLDRKPLDWKKFFNTDSIPAIGKMVKVDDITGEVFVGTQEEYAKKFADKQKEIAKKVNPQGNILGRELITDGIGSKLKESSESLKAFLDDKTFQTAAEKLQTDVNQLNQAFMNATKDIPVGSPTWLDAVKVFRERMQDLSEPKAKKEKTSDFASFSKDITNEIKTLTIVNSLLKEGKDLDEAQLRAKAKLAGFTNETQISQLINLKTTQEQLLDKVRIEENIRKELNDIKSKEIPISKEINNLLQQGIPLEDAKAIAELNHAGITHSLIAELVNQRSVQKDLIETSKKQEEITSALNSVRNEEIPILSGSINLMKEGKNATEAMNIARFSLLTSSPELLKQFTEEQTKLSSLQEEYDFYSQIVDIVKKSKEDSQSVQEQYNKKVEALNTFFKEGERDGAAYQEAIRGIKEELSNSDPILKKFNEIFEQTDSQKLVNQRKDIELLYQAYSDGVKQVDGTIKNISFEEFSEMVNVVLGRTTKDIEETTDIMQELFKEAARNSQNALANFLYDPFSEGLDGMFYDLLDVMRRMAAEAIAAQIFKGLEEQFGSLESIMKGELSFDGVWDSLVSSFDDAMNSIVSIADDIWSWISSLFSSSGSGSGFFAGIGSLFGASSTPSVGTDAGFLSSISSMFGFAEGGPVSGPGTGTSDSIMAKLSNGEYVMPAEETKKYFPILEEMRKGSLDQLPKFANGGIVSSTNYRANTSNTITSESLQNREKPTLNLNPKIINLLDKSLIGEYLKTDDGEKLVVNIIQKNRTVLGN